MRDDRPPASGSAAAEAARWALVQEQFHAALALPPGRRSEHLASLRRTDPVLADEVQSLLRAHERSGLLGEPRAPDGTEMPRLYGLDTEQFGPYRIIRPLGRGGMGAVYLAERRCPGFTQLVALKLLRADFSAPRLLERFKVERRILAKLEHPGIARLIDAGSTPGGQPYFAMEFVEGVTLTDHCEHTHPDVEQKLRIFLEICDAVAYAHQRLVVHRDLKPGNILVGDCGRVKLLDFGIARVIEDDDDESTATTGTAHWFTPDYAAPEQVRGESASTLADVYALGAVLYQLLTGFTPLQLGRRSYAELEEAICHQVPVRPSDRVTSPPLQRRLTGDLDLIVLKALAKEPERRYASARQLADDVRRHLDHQPVRARPDRLGYRAIKFVRRHRTAVAVGTLGALILVAGLAGVSWQAAAARHARVRAEQALQESQAVTGFLTGLFDATAPTNESGDPAAAGEILRRGRARAEELAGQPLAQARMLDALGLVAVSLGRYAEAHEMLSRALAMRRNLLGADHPDAVESLRHEGDVLRRLTRLTESESAFREALATRQRTLPADDPAIAESYADLGFLMPYLGRLDEAEQYYREALRIKRANLGDNHPDVEHAKVRVAAVLRRRGRYDSAIALVREAVASREAREGARDPSVANILVFLGDLIYHGTADTAEAERIYRTSLDIHRAALGSDHLDLLHDLESLSELLTDTGRQEEAMALQREGLRIQLAVLGPDHPLVFGAYDDMARLLRKGGQLAEAEAMSRKALAGWQHKLGAEHTTVGQSMLLLSGIMLDRDEIPAADSMVRSGIAMLSRLHGPDHGLVAGGRIILGRVLTRQGRLAEAERELRQAVRILDARGVEAGEHEAHDALADVLEQAGRFAEARAERARAAQLRARDNTSRLGAGRGPHL